MPRKKLLLNIEEIVVISWQSFRHHKMGDEFLEVPKSLRKLYCSIDRLHCLTYFHFHLDVEPGCIELKYAQSKGVVFVYTSYIDTLK